MEFINTCLITTGEFRSLALYSHLLPTIVSLILGFFVYRFSDRSVKVRLFALFTILLSAWLLSDLVAWHSDNYYAVGAFWSILDALNVLFYVVLLNFIYTMTAQKSCPPIWLVGVSILITLPVITLTAAGLSVLYFDETNCEMSTNEVLAKYKLLVEAFSIAMVGLFGAHAIFKNFRDARTRNRTITLTISSMLFLCIFTGSEYISTATDIYEINLYALFALPVYILILTFSIIEQKTFNIVSDSFLYAKLLFFIFMIVAGFNLVLADDIYEFMITGASTIVTTGFGMLLLRSARREVEQREQIEKLATTLEHTNIKLKELDKQKSEFVSIASHQLRSPLTAIRGYASMMQEGSFGAVPEKLAEPMRRIEESGKFMATLIDDFLNVSRIEAGNMKYDFGEFSLTELASTITNDLQTDALNHGLLLLYRSEVTANGIVNADRGKTQQVLHNVINNAIKYTKKGSVTVYIHNTQAHYVIDIIDTGIGISPETSVKLFEKFTRAKLASSSNIAGTGLGLFVAREMARAMGGDITVYSEGEGKGSKFTITMPRPKK